MATGDATGSVPGRSLGNVIKVVFNIQMIIQEAKRCQQSRRYRGDDKTPRKGRSQDYCRHSAAPMPGRVSARLSLRRRAAWAVGRCSIRTAAGRRNPKSTIGHSGSHRGAGCLAACSLVGRGPEGLTHRWTIPRHTTSPVSSRQLTSEKREMKSSVGDPRSEWLWQECPIVPPLACRGLAECPPI